MRYVVIVLSCLCLSLPFQGQAQSSYRDRTSAERYLLTALDFISRYSYYTERIDWNTHREKMLIELANADPDDIEAAYPLIEETLDLLGDSHSNFLTPEQYANNFRPERVSTGLLTTPPDSTVYLVYPESPAADAGIEVGDKVLTYETHNDSHIVSSELQRPDGTTYSVELEQAEFSNRAWTPDIAQRFGDCIAYVESHHLLAEEIQSDYVATIWQAVRRVQADGDVCGWIVDLRRNQGGLIAAILLGVAPLVGERDFFQQVYPLSERMWSYEDEGIHINGVIELGAPGGEDAPVVDMSLPLVVLTGNNTGSAGEMALMAFRERPNTYVIGEETAGAATHIATSTRSDEALLYVTTARLADPDGTIYDLSLQPDEVVPVQWDVFGTADDPAIQAALDWIEAARTD